MIAKVIKKDKREYFSYVFAMFNVGWYTSVIIFDNVTNKFDYLDIYKRTPSLK